mmetsp:Transcript_28566/g.94794  ORF Transcript_28566/g.94794 Transcript_28566/m.94794 type:complete len:255 (+) Transcript_28566:1314-2078(+)
MAHAPLKSPAPRSRAGSHRRRAAGPPSRAAPRASRRGSGPRRGRSSTRGPPGWQPRARRTWHAQHRSPPPPQARTKPRRNRDKPSNGSDHRLSTRPRLQEGPARGPAAALTQSRRTRRPAPYPLRTSGIATEPWYSAASAKLQREGTVRWRRGPHGVWQGPPGMHAGQGSSGREGQTLDRRRPPTSHRACSPSPHPQCSWHPVCSPHPQKRPRSGERTRRRDRSTCRAPPRKRFRPRGSHERPVVSPRCAPPCK